MPDAVFAHILDQSEAIEQIEAAMAHDRLPHGVIFAGPPGVGKATTAVALAKRFLSSGDDAAYVARLIDAGTHPDFHLITKELIRLTSKTSKATTLSIDVIRDHLVAPAMRKSIVGVGKVFVVEEADSMQPSAQNAMLKTLEEPAGRTLIILLTPRPEDLLSTVRSRAQVFRFGALPDKTVFNQLKLRGYDPKIADLATRLADGSLGTALKWIEDGVINHARDLTSHLDGLLLGRPTADLAEWLKKAADDYAAKQLERDENASKDNATRAGINTYLLLAARHLRANLRTADEETLEPLCQAIDAIRQCETYLDGNVNISLALQQLASALSRPFAAT
ncbi:MAG TPA: AAA family ATPase [Tepidisphaeraceae bacterium]|jgi:DNA polymerase-3 subunit delta'